MSRSSIAAHEHKSDDAGCYAYEISDATERMEGSPPAFDNPQNMQRSSSPPLDVFHSTGTSRPEKNENAFVFHDYRLHRFADDGLKCTSTPTTADALPFPPPLPRFDYPPPHTGTPPPISRRLYQRVMYIPPFSYTRSSLPLVRCTFPPHPFLSSPPDLAAASVSFTPSAHPLYHALQLVSQRVPLTYLLAAANGQARGLNEDECGVDTSTDEPPTVTREDDVVEMSTERWDTRAAHPPPPSSVPSTPATGLLHALRTATLHTHPPHHHRPLASRPVSRDTYLGSYRRAWMHVWGGWAAISTDADADMDADMNMDEGDGDEAASTVQRMRFADARYAEEEMGYAARRLGRAAHVNPPLLASLAAEPRTAPYTASPRPPPRRTTLPQTNVERGLRHPAPTPLVEVGGAWVYGVWAAMSGMAADRGWGSGCRYGCGYAGICRGGDGYRASVDVALTLTGTDGSRSRRRVDTKRGGGGDSQGGMGEGGELTDGGGAGVTLFIESFDEKKATRLHRESARLSVHGVETLGRSDELVGGEQEVSCDEGQDDIGVERGLRGTYVEMGLQTATYSLLRTTNNQCPGSSLPHPHTAKAFTSRTYRVGRFGATREGEGRIHEGNDTHTHRSQAHSPPLPSPAFQRGVDSSAAGYSLGETPNRCVEEESMMREAVNWSGKEFVG
ncbi:hypothetical protein R3P38DRAFT_2758720 [Favolaschia claudopus]|uniref:Uncharacterized protein n=1 Tax=Favolaschia claudopus TaxID=2862362 RepID=A0AAW0EDM6_9AGAR